jgi:hypothetical protein
MNMEEYKAQKLRSKVPITASTTFNLPLFTFQYCL